MQITLGQVVDESRVAITQFAAYPGSAAWWRRVCGERVLKLADVLDRMLE